MEASNQSEIHYNIQGLDVAHKITSLAAQQIMQLRPELILGESNLFKYDVVNQNIELSQPFQNLLRLLVELHELDHRVLSVKTLQELNGILQQPQGFHGGLLRKDGTERWHLVDNSVKGKHRRTLELFFQQLGFYFPKNIDFPMTVDHCIIFGGRLERMEKRIFETLNYLENNLSVTGHIFLLGSNRNLIVEEKNLLKKKIEKHETSRRSYWTEIFNDPKRSTEGNAFEFLWECIVPQETQNLLKEKLITINSTKIGNSYQDHYGIRVTTERTVEDWISFYKTELPQSIFSIAEQPYSRLADQLQFTVLSNGKKAKREEIIKRIQNTTFYFACPAPNSYPLVSVVLDEIARNVYRVTESLKYLEQL